MKLVKLDFIMYQKTKKRKHFLIRLDFTKEECQSRGNFIRRYLIKNTSRLEIFLLNNQNIFIL